MGDNSDIWYYSRAELAKQYMDVLDTGITRRLTIFSPRRTGKTNFLVRDLAKEAEKRKRIVVYVSMWDNQDAPHLWLINVLQDVVDGLSKKSGIRRVLMAPIKKLKLESVAGLAKIGAEIEFSDKPKAATSSELGQLSQLFKTLHGLAKKQKILLLFDEIQHLTTSRKFNGFTHNLRTSLDIYSSKIEAVFTGSSRTGLGTLFSDSRAPLYAFSDQIVFPALDCKYTEFTLQVFKLVTKRNLDRKKALAIFEKLGRNPFYFRMVLQAMIIQASNDIDSCYADVRENIALQLGYKEKWADLKTLDRVVYLAVADKSPIYSAETLQTIAENTGQDITASQVQRSLERLLKKHMISSVRRSEYTVENPGFTDWCVANG